jgi:hypothetical protein
MQLQPADQGSVSRFRWPTWHAVSSSMCTITQRRGTGPLRNEGRGALVSRLGSWSATPRLRSHALRYKSAISSTESLAADSKSLDRESASELLRPTARRVGSGPSCGTGQETAKRCALVGVEVWVRLRIVIEGHKRTLTIPPRSAGIGSRYAGRSSPDRVSLAGLNDRHAVHGAFGTGKM